MDSLTRRGRLEQSRDYLQRAMGECELKELAALSREYRLVLAELDSLPDPNAEVSGADEIAARRAARGAGPKGSARSKRSG